MATVTRKLFLEVDDAAAVAADVERALFVPTRLPWQLGEHLILGLRMPGHKGAKRALEIPVAVVGRRPARTGSLLSAGVLVKLADPADPLVEVLREIAAGRVVDLEARLQERLRLPARVRYPTRDEACAELLGLLGDDGALLDVQASFARGDRLLLTVEIGGPVGTQSSSDDGVVSVALTVSVLVRRLQQNDGKNGVVAVALDDAARARITAFLDEQSLDHSGPRSLSKSGSPGGSPGGSLGGSLGGSGGLNRGVNRRA